MVVVEEKAKIWVARLGVNPSYLAVEPRASAALSNEIDTYSSDWFTKRDTRPL